MSTDLKLLIVEDDEKQIEWYKNSIESFNETSETKITLSIKKDKDDGLNALKEETYDGAIVDLKLYADDMDGAGNEILKEIKNKLRFPVRVISGYPETLNEELKDENVFFKSHRRTDDFISIIKELVSLYKTGITKILGNRGLIDDHLTDIFWNHISTSLSYWLREDDSINMEKILSRHISALLSEYLEISESGELDKYHPSEVYIIPPVKRHFFTGNVLKKRDNDNYFILLNPACDMVRRYKRHANGNQITFRNAESFLLCKLVLWNSLEEFSGVKPDTGRSNDSIRHLKDYVENKKDRYHFLPPFKEVKGFFIDFQSLSSFSENMVDKDFTIVATISREFLKDILARFSRYYSRQGQPDLDSDKIIDDLLKGLKTK